MEPGVFGYVVDAGQHEPDAVRNLLGKLQLDSAWLRLSELAVGDRALLWIELFDLDTGGPVDLPGLGLALSEEGRWATLVAVDPTDRGTALEHYADGEQKLAFGGTWNTFSHEIHGEGREGFLRAAQAVTGLDWNALTVAAAALPRIDQQADDRTELLLRGRVLGIPEGMPRRPELFRLHYADDIVFGLEGDDDKGELDDDEEDLDDLDDDDGADDADDEEDDELDHDAALEAFGGDDDGQLMLLLLDPQLVGFLWEEAPAAHVSAFLKALEPVRGAVLGPLAHALPDVQGMVQAQLPDRPLADSPLRELLVYEVLSMATAVGFVAGDTVDYYERVFFPLLGLGEGPVVPDAVRTSLEDIRHLDTLSAMVEVMPYAAPEGELLECFGDEELEPLAGWAGRDGVYEGSLFLLDVERLAGLVQRFDVGQLARRVEEFRAVWADQLPPGNQWHAGEADLDELELARFEHRLQELTLLLALAESNRLQPALFFYD